MQVEDARQVVDRGLGLIRVAETGLDRLRRQPGDLDQVDELLRVMDEVSASLTQRSHDEATEIWARAWDELVAVVRATRVGESEEVTTRKLREDLGITDGSISWIGGFIVRETVMLSDFGFLPERAFRVANRSGREFERWAVANLTADYSPAMALSFEPVHGLTEMLEAVLARGDELSLQWLVRMQINAMESALAQVINGITEGVGVVVADELLWEGNLPPDLGLPSSISAMIAAGTSQVGAFLSRLRYYRWASSQ